MLRVVVESPYAGDLDGNWSYLQDCMLWCLDNGASPYASHGLLTECLDDTDPTDRALGFDAGFAWREAADETWAFVDRGLSPGMRRGIVHAHMVKHPVRYVSVRRGFVDT